MSDLVNQPTARTARKVQAAAWSAAWIAPASTLGAGLVTELWLPELAEYHTQIEALITMTATGIGTWLVGYYTRERRENMLEV